MSGDLGARHQPVGAQPESRGPVPLALVISSAAEVEQKGLSALLDELCPRPEVAYVLYVVPSAEPALAEADRSSPHTASVASAPPDPRLRRGEILVLPGDTSWKLDGDRFVRTDDEGVRRRPLSSLLRSLASEHGSSLTVALLTPVSADAASGLGAVHEAGGLVLASEDLKDHFSAGRHLLDTTLPREEVAPALARLGEGGAQGNGQDKQPSQPDVERILTLVKQKTGHDFHAYERRRTLRRIQRRMRVVEIDDVLAYAQYIRDSADEPDLLARELSFGLSQFFRDPELFALLGRTVLPNIMRHKPPGSSVRLWVPACATGEEAYSLAMLFMQEMAQQDRELLVFATDIDQDVLSAARYGEYSTALEAEIPRPFLEQYVKASSKSSYRVDKRIRDCVIFSAHDIITDPPFSKLDLVFCSNLLSRLSSALQDGVISRFHYALAPRGYLVVGEGPGVGARRDLFSSIGQQGRVFQRRELPVGVAPRPTSSSSLRPDPPAALPAGASSEALSLPEHGQPSAGGRERPLLDTAVSACVVINENLDIVYFLGDTSRYLRPPAGVPTVNLLEVARAELRNELRGCVHRALDEGRATICDVGAYNGHRRARVSVRPVVETATDGLYLVTFEEGPALTPPALAPPERPPSHYSATEELARELERTQQHLQIIVTEFQASTEDLRSSNEELLSMNEELQSSNEELETTKEELQSSNEELEAVNSELESRLEELARANNDVRNLLENTRIATLFLDGELRIMNFTPTATELFTLVNTDRGRPIEHITQRFRYERLKEDVKEVIASLHPRETQVQSDAGGWFMLRILPYRSVQNVIEGAVVTFTDITALESAQLDVQRLSAAYERQFRWLEALTNVVPVGIAYHEKGMQGVRLNKTAVAALGLPSESLLVDAQPLAYQAWVGGCGGVAHTALQRAVTSDSPVRDLEIELGGEEGPRHLMLSSALLADTSSATYGQVSAFLDITEIRRARELAVAREQQQAIIAELGIRALGHGDLTAFLSDGLKMLCRAAHVDACDIMQLSESKDMLFSSCRTGWAKDDIQVTEVIDPRGPVSTALRQGEPIFFQRSRTREGWPAYLDDDAIESGVRLAITSDKRQPFGLIGLYTRTPREFSRHDLHFLRAGVLVITAAVQRQLIDEARLREREAAALRRSEEQLRRAERLASLGTFAAGIAHELNNPLNNISLAADYAAQSPDLERRARLLTAIKSNAQRCGQIVESVLRFARDEVTERRALGADSIIRHAVDLLRSEFKPDRLSIKLSIEEQLPKIIGNATELEQVFVNLLRNAVEAHPGHCHVEIKMLTSGAYLRVVVADDGPGIAAKDLPHIFDPFFSTRRKQGGTGLGLSITHRIVAAHGGSIRVSTAQGRGTTFEIELPLAPEGGERR